MRTAPYTRQIPQQEAALVECICEGLELRGRIVLRIGQRNAQKAGSDCGAPDLLVYDKAGRWIGLEVKPHERAKVRPEQRWLSNIGAVSIVTSLAEAFRVCGEKPP